MKFKLEDICSLRKEKISIEKLTIETYISTENMLPNKAGIVNASALPTIRSIQAYQKGDILISNIRPYFKKIWKAKINGGCSNDILVFKTKKNTDKDFLYYILADDAFFIYAMATSKGTKMPRGDKISIMQYEVPYFDVKIQKKIASILKSIDEKIEIYKQINNNLEQQAHALYCKFLSDKIINGVFKDIVIENKKSKIKVSEAQDINGEYPFFTSGKRILEYNSYLVDNRNIYLNTGGNADVKYYIGKASYSTDTWCITTKNNLTNYCYLFLKNIQNEIDAIYFEGSALKHLQKKKLLEKKIYIPNIQETQNLNEILDPLFEIISKNIFQNRYLSFLRDALLSKLMSGEFDISEIDI